MSQPCPPRLLNLLQLLELKGLTLLPSYTNREAATVFSCSPRTILNYIKKGLLRPRVLPGRKTFLPVDLEELLLRKAGM